MPETKLSYEVRIDLVKAKTSPKESRIHWVDVNGVIHLADPQKIKYGDAWYIVTIANEKKEFPDYYLEWASSNYLVTQSRMQAESCYRAWVEWAEYNAKIEESLELRTHRKKLPKHSAFWCI